MYFIYISLIYFFLFNLNSIVFFFLFYSIATVVGGSDKNNNYESCESAALNITLVVTLVTRFLCGQFTECTFFTPFTHTHALYPHAGIFWPDFRFVCVTLNAFLFLKLFSLN